MFKSLLNPLHHDFKSMHYWFNLTVRLLQKSIQLHLNPFKFGPLGLQFLTNTIPLGYYIHALLIPCYFTIIIKIIWISFETSLNEPTWFQIQPDLIPRALWIPCIFFAITHIMNPAALKIQFNEFHLVTNFNETIHPASESMR